MAGGLGGLGGFDFGGVLGAIGQSLLTSPRDAPFSGLPAAMQARAKMQEHQAELGAMSMVAEKLGIPKELAASPQAMKMFVEHINQQKLNELRAKAAQGMSLMPPDDDSSGQPGMSVPGGGQGGLGGLGGMGGQRSGQSLPSGQGAIGQYARAIQGNESGGNYQAVGPRNSRLGRALGAYQVMEANIPQWSREALGREVSPDEFLKSKEIQDTIFQHRFGSYVQKYGSPERAAAAWFSGSPDTTSNKRDVLGTSVPEYVRRFQGGLQSAGGGQAPDAGGQPTGAVAKLAGLGADPRTVAIVSAAQKYLPQGYTIEQISGHRPGDTGHHGEGKGATAIDVRILDPEGKPIGGDRGHMGEDPTGLYTRLARGAYTELLATNPNLAGQFAWGGAFGTQKGTGAGPRDLMHFDLGGERGRYERYRLSNLGPLDGGGVPRQGMAMGQPGAGAGQGRTVPWSGVGGNIVTPETRVPPQLAALASPVIPGTVPTPAGVGAIAGGVGIASPAVLEEARRRMALGLDPNTPKPPATREQILETIDRNGRGIEDLERRAGQPMGLYRPAGTDGRIASADPNFVSGVAPALPTPEPILRPGEKGYAGPTGPVPLPPARPSDLGGGIPLPPPRPADIGLPRAAAPVPSGLSPSGAPTVLPGPVPRGPAAAPAQAGGTLDPASAAALTRLVRNVNDPAALAAARPILDKIGEGGPLLERWGALKDQGLPPDAIIAALQQPAGQQTQGAPQGAPLGQSGAPLDQVASSGSRMPRVPIPDTTIQTPPATTAAPSPTEAGPATPPAARGTNKTKAWAQQQFQVGMNILAASNGDPVLMKQAEILMARAAKYGDPSDIAKRIGEAGLAGTPYGRAKIADMPQGVLEKLAEQQVPGYEAPATFERRKYADDLEERAYRRGLEERRLANTIGEQTLQHQHRERVFKSDQEEKAFRRGLSEKQYGLEERKFGQTVSQQDRQFQQHELDQAQRAADAAEARRIQLMDPTEKRGAALNDPTRGANVQTGLAAEADQKARVERGEATAKAQVLSQQALPKVTSDTATTLETIQRLRNHPGRDLATGGTSVVWGAPGSQVKDFRVLLDQAKGQVFGQAYETLRGAQGITEIEGTKATNALARLEKAQSKEAFLQALDDFAGVVMKGQDVVRQKAGQPPLLGDMSSGEIAQSLQAARAKIQKNPEARDAVIQRLQQSGIDPRGL